MSRLSEFSSIFYIIKEIYDNEKVTLTRKNSKKSKKKIKMKQTLFHYYMLNFILFYKGFPICNLTPKRI